MATETPAQIEEPGVVSPPETPLSTKISQLFADNLFKDAKNSVLTLVFGGLLGYAAFRAFTFLFANDKLATRDGEQVLVSGWEVVRNGPLITYMIGNRFNDTTTPLADGPIPFWSLWAAIYVLALTLGLLLGRAAAMAEEDAPKAKLSTRLGMLLPPILGAVATLSMAQTITPWLLTAAVPVVAIVGRILGGSLPSAIQDRLGLLSMALTLLSFLFFVGFNPGNVNSFGGLLLTLIVAFASITLCFPIGVVMALARRSTFPLIRPIAVGYIELIRGVPLITLLFFGQFALGFLLPPGTDAPSPVTRAIVMITLFSGAYVAEVVRGGLQSVPAGQTEAGQAVGLQPLTITFRIILPQALRNSIPALIGQFISLLKDTSLLAIIGLFDLFGVTGSILRSLQFTNQGFTPEAYAYVAFMFWVVCFSMSRASQRLETRLGVGTR